MKNECKNVCLSLIVILLTFSVGKTEPIVIQDVPAYNWYHGCGPTSIAMVMGYWDLQGYSNLLQAEGDDLYLTEKVKDEITSPQHIATNYPAPYNPIYPVPPPNNTSIADWLGTSADGISLAPNIIPAILGWTDYKGYEFQASGLKFSTTGSLLWSTLITEINNGRPMLFLVDSNGSGSTNHLVPAIGYEDRGVNGLWYAVYTTWSENEVISWYQYRKITSGNIFGVSTGFSIKPITQVPEPSVFLLIVMLLPSIKFYWLWNR